MRGRLVDLGLLHRGRANVRMGIHLALVFAPWVAFFAWLLTADGDVVLPVSELVVNFSAIALVPMLVLAVPKQWDATRIGKGALERSATGPEPVLAERERQLTHAWESRFVGL